MNNIYLQKHYSERRNSRELEITNYERKMVAV